MHETEPGQSLWPVDNDIGVLEDHVQLQKVIDALQQTTQDVDWTGALKITNLICRQEKVLDLSDHDDKHMDDMSNAEDGSSNP